jgi:hypothetical protein
VNEKEADESADTAAILSCQKKKTNEKMGKTKKKKERLAI